ncbi:MAG TPA: ABC-type transport auxiliary lipoprotein family protein [Lacunisphaera sp.]|nr:ABC-type transport auxiliary lipoprotein family protein [Lacunisphaera sp.]
MKTNGHKWKVAARGLQLSALGFLLASCGLPEPQADVVRHFTLGGEVGAGPVANATQVRPVRLAGHLHGRSMAVRVAANEISYLEEVRWAEPLDEALTEILRARLGTVPGGATVSVDVVRFELVRSEGNSVQLQADYSILPAGARRTDAIRGVFKSSPRTWEGKDPAELVTLMRAAAGELADALAAAVTAVKPAGQG